MQLQIVMMVKRLLFLLLVKVENLMCFLIGSSNIKHCGLGI